MRTASCQGATHAREAKTRIEEMLKDLPVEFVKIDREVVVKALSESTTRAVLISIWPLPTRPART